MNSFAVCMRSMVQILGHAFFLQNVSCTYIQTCTVTVVPGFLLWAWYTGFICAYTDFYPFLRVFEGIQEYILLCTCESEYIPVYTGVYHVHHIISLNIRAYTSMYSSIPVTCYSKYVPVHTGIYMVCHYTNSPNFGFIMLNMKYFFMSGVYGNMHFSTKVMVQYYCEYVILLLCMPIFLNPGSHQVVHFLRKFR